MLLVWIAMGLTSVAFFVAAYKFTCIETRLRAHGTVLKSLVENQNYLMDKDDRMADSTDGRETGILIKTAAEKREEQALQQKKEMFKGNHRIFKHANGDFRFITEKDDYTVSYICNEETMDKVFGKLARFITDNGYYSGESIHQSDLCSEKMMDWLTDVVENDMKFKVEYHEE